MSWPQQPSQDRRRPALAAELEVFSAADALQWAGISRFTGRLAFRAEATRINVLLDQGAVVNASTNNVAESLGRHLFATGLVDEVDLAAAVVYSRDNHARVGTALIALGVLDGERLEEALRSHTLNLACRPLSWKSGRLSAEAIELVDYPRLTSQAIDVTFLLMAAALREDQAERVREVFPDDRAVVTAAPLDVPANLAPGAKRFLQILRPGDTLDSLYDRLGGDRHEMMLTANDLLDVGLIVLGGREAEAPSAG